MKLSKRFKIPSLPRLARLILCLFACILLLLFAYFMGGMPAFSPEAALRRAERRALIGMQGELLGEKASAISLNGDDTRLLAVSYGSRAAAIFGTARDSFFGAGWSAHDNGAFYIVPKSEDGATVMAYPGYPSYIPSFGDPLVLAVFHDFPGAVRAELTLTVETVSSYTDFSAAYALEAQQEHEGVFFFIIHNNEDADETEFINSSETYALWALSKLADPVNASSTLHFKDGKVPASLVFYGEDGSVIAAVETEVATALL